jgi:hypothetical protein
MLFSFLTTEANAEVGVVHEKAMPICLLTETDRETWMRSEIEDALALQRPPARIYPPCPAYTRGSPNRPAGAPVQPKVTTGKRLRSGGAT